MNGKYNVADETSHYDVLGGLESVDRMRGFEEAKREHSLADDSVDEVAVGETRSPNLSPHWPLESCICCTMLRTFQLNKLTDHIMAHLHRSAKMILKGCVNSSPGPGRGSRNLGKTF